MYQERMNSYYPQVIRAISEFQAIIDGEYPEFEELSVSKERIPEDAYLLTMSEDRVKQWEAVLGIKPLESSTLEDRREATMKNEMILPLSLGSFSPCLVICQ